MNTFERTAFDVTEMFVNFKDVLNTYPSEHVTYLLFEMWRYCDYPTTRTQIRIMWKRLTFYHPVDEEFKDLQEVMNSEELGRKFTERYGGLTAHER